VAGKKKLEATKIKIEKFENYTFLVPILGSNQIDVLKKFLIEILFSQLVIGVAPESSKPVFINVILIRMEK